MSSKVFWIAFGFVALAVCCGVFLATGGCMGTSYCGNELRSSNCGVQMSPPTCEPPVDMFFQQYGVNPAVETAQDSLSTFAVDVDTGSYTIMRRYLGDGNLPARESVRPEEYLNYFRYGYEPPEQGDFAIHMDGAPWPFAENRHVLRVGLKGREIDASDRKDATLVFVIDVSGSMNGQNRLGLVKKSLEMLVRELHQGDEVGIVVYGSEARKVLSLTSAARSDKILDAIASVRSEGSTNAEQGLRMGYDMAVRGLRRGRNTRVILCSDGVANVGLTDSGSILDTIKQAVSRGVTLTTIGFGMGNYNDTLMEQLADNGNGSYYYVDTIREARRVLVENLTGTLQTIAKDAKVQVEFNPETVLRYRLVGYENRFVADDDFRNDTVDAGEIGAGHSVTAVYVLELVDGAEGVLATTRLRYEHAETGEVIELAEALSAGDLATDFDSAPACMRLAATVAEFAEVLRASPFAEGVSLGLVHEYAVGAGQGYRDSEDVTEFVDLVRRAASLKEQ